MSLAAGNDGAGPWPLSNAGPCQKQGCSRGIPQPRSDRHRDHRPGPRPRSPLLARSICALLTCPNYRLWRYTPVFYATMICVGCGRTPEPLRAALAPGCPRARLGQGDGGGGGGSDGGSLRGGPLSSGLGRTSQNTSAVTAVSNPHTTTPAPRFSQSTSVISASAWQRHCRL